MNVHLQVIMTANGKVDHPCSLCSRPSPAGTELERQLHTECSSMQAVISRKVSVGQTALVAFHIETLSACSVESPDIMQVNRNTVFFPSYFNSLKHNPKNQLSLCPIPLTYFDRIKQHSYLKCFFFFFLTRQILFKGDIRLHCSLSIFSCYNLWLVL